MLERWPMLMPQRGRSTLSLGRSPGLRRLSIIACCSELLRRSVNSTGGPSSCVRVLSAGGGGDSLFFCPPLFGARGPFPPPPLPRPGRPCPPPPLFFPP